MKPLKDAYQKDILIDDTGFQVMMEWEKSYMEAMVNELNPTGDVLEIGFGFGYSANEIQKHNILSHTIIESDPDVIKKAKEWAKLQTHTVKIVEGLWQECLSDLNTFDSFFLDDSPNERYPDYNNTRVYDFYYMVLNDHANRGARMTWYCDAPIYWLSHPKTTWSFSEFKTDIPDNCNYVPEFYGIKTVYIPIVSFPFGNIKGVTYMALDKFMNFIKKESNSIEREIS